MPGPSDDQANDILPEDSEFQAGISELQTRTAAQEAVTNSPVLTKPAFRAIRATPPGFIPEYTGNPFPRGPDAPDLPGLFNLSLHQRHRVVDVPGAPKAAVIEHETLSCALSYLFDGKKLCEELEALASEEVLPWIQLFKDHYAGIFKILNARSCELVLRVQHSDNTAFLSAVDAERRGVGPRLCEFDESIGRVCNKFSDLLISQQLKKSTKEKPNRSSAVRSSARTRPDKTKAHAGADSSASSTRT
jgi:hypothetical protein